MPSFSTFGLQARYHSPVAGADSPDTVRQHFVPYCPHSVIRGTVLHADWIGVASAALAYHKADGIGATPPGRILDGDEYMRPWYSTGSQSPFAAGDMITNSATVDQLQP